MQFNIWMWLTKWILKYFLQNKHTTGLPFQLQRVHSQSHWALKLCAGLFWVFKEAFVIVVSSEVACSPLPCRWGTLILFVFRDTSTFFVVLNNFPACSYRRSDKHSTFPKFVCFYSLVSHLEHTQHLITMPNTLCDIPDNFRSSKESYSQLGYPR